MALVSRCGQGCLLHPNPSSAAHLAVLPGLLAGWAGAELPMATAHPPASSWPWGRKNWGHWLCSPCLSPFPVQPQGRAGRSMGTALSCTAQQAGLIDRL